jgi:hypothetical protein
MRAKAPRRVCGEVGAASIAASGNHFFITALASAANGFPLARLLV